MNQKLPWYTPFLNSMPASRKTTEALTDSSASKIFHDGRAQCCLNVLFYGENFPLHDAPQLGFLVILIFPRSFYWY
jgi:hypothetical protein